MPTVRGSLSLPSGAPDTAATVRIRVENVTRADAAAQVVGEQVLHDVSLRGLRFEVPVAKVDRAARYTVRVHVDLAGTGVLSTGDLLTTQSVPVLTHGAPDEVIVPVTPLD
jgi:type III secretion system (T3SS) chaperone YscW